MGHCCEFEVHPPFLPCLRVPRLCGETWYKCNGKNLNPSQICAGNKNTTDNGSWWEKTKLIIVKERLNICGSSKGEARCSRRSICQEIGFAARSGGSTRDV